VRYVMRESDQFPWNFAVRSSAMIHSRSITPHQVDSLIVVFLGSKCLCHAWAPEFGQTFFCG
jgi:hypothetical protein